MALVAYGSSEESDLSDNEEEVSKTTASKTSELVQVAQQDSTAVEGEISDEENEWIGQATSGIEDLDIPGLSTSQSIFSSLPQASITNKDSLEDQNLTSFVDENEDLTTIPEAKTYESAPAVIPVKKNKKGPIRIMAPTISNADSDDDDDEAVPKPRRIRPAVGSTKKNNLLSLLPPPKNSASSSAPSTSGSTTATSSIKSTLVPRSITRPPVRTAVPSSRDKARRVEKKEEHSDSDDDTPFFTLEKEEILPVQEEDEAFKARLATVHATPEASAPLMQHNYDSSTDVYGPATAPYPPVAPETSTSQYDSRTDEEIALHKLVGHSGMKRKRGEEINFVEVTSEDLKADPREWMTQALADEAEKGEPGPKCNIKGEKKRKHQITYLAALAKEREHVLKQQWAANAQSRRATQSKYGF